MSCWLPYLEIGSNLGLSICLLPLEKAHFYYNQGTFTEGEGSEQFTSLARLLVLLIAKISKYFLILKAADLSSLVQGGQPYGSFPFIKDSLF
jgi:hypothetical protein